MVYTDLHRLPPQRPRLHYQRHPIPVTIATAQAAKDSSGNIDLAQTSQKPWVLTMHKTTTRTSSATQPAIKIKAAFEASGQPRCTVGSVAQPGSELLMASAFELVRRPEARASAAITATNIEGRAGNLNKQHHTPRCTWSITVSRSHSGSTSGRFQCSSTPRLSAHDEATPRCAVRGPCVIFGLARVAR